MATKSPFIATVLRALILRSEEGKEKWTAHKFAKNVYDIFMPKHYKLICSVIDDIPADLKFDVPSASFGSKTPISTEAEPDSQDIAASAPTSQDLPNPKRKKLTGNEELKRQVTERHENTLGGLVRALQQELEQQRQDNEQVVTLLQQQLQDSKEQMRQQLQDSKEEMRQQQEQNKQLIAALQSLSAQPKQKSRKQKES